MIIGQKDSKLLILNIPFWHPEGFVMSADGKEKNRRHHDNLLFSYKARSRAANEQVNPFRGCKAPS